MDEGEEDRFRFRVVTHGGQKARFVCEIQLSTIDGVVEVEEEDSFTSSVENDKDDRGGVGEGDVSISCSWGVFA